MNDKEIKKLAANITDDLFVNGAGQRAAHLALQSGNGRNLGSWSDCAVQARIERWIRAINEPKKPPTP